MPSYRLKLGWMGSRMALKSEFRRLYSLSIGMSFIWSLILLIRFYCETLIEVMWLCVVCIIVSLKLDMSLNCFCYFYNRVDNNKLKQQGVHLQNNHYGNYSALLLPYNYNALFLMCLISIMISSTHCKYSIILSVPQSYSGLLSLCERLWSHERQKHHKRL